MTLARSVLPRKWNLLLLTVVIYDRRVFSGQSDKGSNDSRVVNRSNFLEIGIGHMQLAMKIMNTELIRFAIW